jgi:hypothetical protein
LKLPRYKVHLPGVILAAFAGPHDLLGIGDRCWSVKDLPVGLTDQCPWCRMMAAGAFMDVKEEETPLLS